MTVADRRERDKQLRRDSIVDAAERLFFAKGFAASTIDEVAEAAELSKGTIYLYFKNKDEIYVAIVQRGLRMLMDSFRDIMASSATGMDKVLGLGQALVSFYERHPDHFKAVFYHREVPASSLRDENRDGSSVSSLKQDLAELYALCIGAMRAGLADGSIRPDIDPVKATIVLVGMILGLVRTITLMEEKLLLEKFDFGGSDMIRAAFEMIGRPLASGGAPAPPEGH